ncbi:response regulator transcription factor [Emticicia sp. 17c]|uniref:response regulator transcription factor n=1 Tax=Emticicia sp. 17c TaxID=3127704 RepID=UPI00301CFD99
MAAKIKLFLADSYLLFMEGLSLMLLSSDKFEVIGSASNQAELLSGLRKNPCDILLIDLNLLFQGHTLFIEDLRKHYKNKILVLHDAVNLSHLKKIQINVNGFLSKTLSSTQLYENINAIAQGQEIITPFVKKYVYAISPSQEELISRYQLTNREVEVIKLIALEFSSTEIASKLCVSEFTVDTYRKNISKKLNARNVASIVNFAHRWELV